MDVELIADWDIINWETSRVLTRRVRLGREGNAREKLAKEIKK